VTSYFYNGSPISAGQPVSITAPLSTSPGYPDNWLDVQNQLVCNNTPVNIDPVTGRIMAGGPQIGPTPLHCDPPMVPNKQRMACTCPEGTELKNGKCVKKNSLLEDILGHVTIGVGVGVGGSSGGNGGGEKPPGH
jgi:hypothetical protein